MGTEIYIRVSREVPGFRVDLCCAGSTFELRIQIVWAAPLTGMGRFKVPGMSFALNASTSVSFSGDVHLHAWLAHQFSGQNAASLSLVSRARQFSSFIVLVGRIISATQFDPKYAVLVQNKDERLCS